MNGYKRSGFSVQQFFRQIIWNIHHLMMEHIAFYRFPGKPHPGIAVVPGFRQPFLFAPVTNSKEVPVFICSFRMKSTDSISYAGHVLVGQLLRFHGHAIQRSRHDDERPVSALRGMLTEGFVKIEQLSESSPAAHVHDARVIYRPFGCKTIRAIALQLVGKIAAGNIHNPAFRFSHSSLDDLPQAVMIL